MLNTNGYYPVEGFQVLEDGLYRMKITAVKEGHYPSGDGYFEISVTAAGFPGSSPNKILMNEAPKIGATKANGNPVTKEDFERWCKDFTRFFDCFGIPRGNWSTSQWVGKEGICKVAPQYDKNEPDGKSKKYKSIFPQLPQAESKQPAAETATATPSGEIPEAIF